MIDFDNMIGVVLDFVKVDGNILVIVIVDYEMGGFVINFGLIYDIIIGVFISDYYMVVMIFVFVYGLGL